MYIDTIQTVSGRDSIATLVLTINPVVTSVTNTTIRDSQLPFSWNGHIYTTAGTYSDTLASAAGCDSIATLIMTVQPVSTDTTTIAVCSNQLPYIWNGHTYTTAGIYRDTSQTISGYDSIAILVLTINLAVTSVTNTTICSNQLPYSWNGRILTTSGTYPDTLRSASGCDSIATLVLSVNPTTFSTTDTTIRASQLPFTWNGHVYTTPGTYSDTLTSASGCDSVATLILHINPAVSSVTNIAICSNQLPYTWNGQTYTAAGTYSDTVQTVSGYDSVATLVLTINPVVTSVTNIAICANQLPYSWNGRNLTASGTYADTLRSASGCDSIATLDLTVSSILTSTTNITICANQLPYTWSGKVYAEAGTYNDTLRSASGCDSIAILVLAVNSVKYSTTDITIRASQLPFSWNNHLYTAPGTYSDTLRSASGCDSIATLILTVQPLSTGTTTVSICSNALPYTWNGQPYTTAGTYYDTLTSTSGGDSIATLVLIINPAVTSVTNLTICSNQLPYSWNGKIITVSGNYSDTLRAASGCDSIATLILNVSPVTYSTTDTTIRASQLPFIWNGHVYTSPGTYSDTLTSASGCDSVATIVLHVNQTLSSVTNVSVCSNQLPYTWNGQTYTTAGTYIDTIQTVSGHDSIATLVLNINPVVTSVTNTTIRTSELPFSWNGRLYTTAGTYRDTLTSASGCDSIATLILTVNPVLTSTTDIAVCSNQLPYNWNGHTYTTAGTYRDTIQTVSGYDSIAILVLTINPAVTSSTNITICANLLPYNWNGKIITAAGSYADTLRSASGCDSIATLVLNINPVTYSTTDTTIRASQLPFTWNGHVYTAPGTYTDTLISAAGCDSVATIILHVNQTLSGITTISICSNQLPYTWNGKAYAAAGTYRDTVQTVSGHDSISILVLTINPVVTSITNTTINASQLPFSWNGRVYTTAGTYTDTLTSASGCDSIATLVLTIQPASTGTTTIAVCSNQLPYSWNGHIYTAAGTYRDTLQTVSGYDSIAILVLTINPAVTSTTNTTICSNQLPYTWNGKIITTSGTYTDTLKSASGCDSIATLVLAVNAVKYSTTDTTVRASQLPFNWNGHVYTTSGTYSDTLRSASGCDSVATIILHVNQAVSGVTNIAICSNQLPYIWNGLSYTKAGTYADTITVAGRDSIRTLVLTINAVVTSRTSISICSNQLPYSWNGKTITAPGTYTAALRTTAGCDSVATLELTVNPILTSTTATTICLNQLPYRWNGNAYRAAGTYTATLRSASGCDSVATLVLTVSPVLYSTVSAIICPNQQDYRWNRRIYTQAGIYTDTLQSAAGCDSVVTLRLIIDTTKTETLSVTICASSYTLPDGVVVTTSGTYTSVVAGVSACGKTIITNLTIQGAPKLVVTNPVPVCAQTTVDLTAAAITAGSDAGLTYKYWTNASATTALANPGKVAASGTYYISATTSGGCVTMKPVTATINAPPVLVITSPVAVCSPATIDLTAAAVTAGSSAGLTYTYWKNAVGTSPVDDPKAVAASGTYFIRASLPQCSFTQMTQVKVTVSRPAQSMRYTPVIAGMNKAADLQARYMDTKTTYRWNPATGLSSTDARTPVFNYNKDMEYTVRLTTAAGCVTVDTVSVLVQTTPTIPDNLKSDIFVPKAWTPNNDGHNDKLFPLTIRIRQLRYFRVFNRWGQLVFETNEIGKGWDGVFNGRPQVTDTYTWMLDATGEDDHHFNLTGNSVLIR